MIERRVRNIALLVAACFFMELLDGTIVITAIPRISTSLGVSPGTTGLVVTAYLVTVAVLIPLSGWLADRFGGARNRRCRRAWVTRRPSYVSFPGIVCTSKLSPLPSGYDDV